MKVQDVMTKYVKSCQLEASLAEAAVTMWEGDCGALPVVDAADKLVGMITDRDIAIAVATRGRRASEISVAEVISGRVYAATPEEDVKAALKTMRQEQVRRLPVVDADQVLQGILCLNDLVRRAEKAGANHTPDISYEDVVGAYQAICRRRPAAKATAV